MQRKKEIFITDKDFIIGHRKEAHISIIRNDKETHELCVKKTSKGLVVENIKGKPGITLNGKKITKRKSLHPGEQVHVKGLTIKFGVERKRETASSKTNTSRVERIKNVYQTLFLSLKRMKPFLTREMLFKEILEKILEVIPSQRVYLLEKKNKKWHSETDRWKKKRSNIHTDWMPVLAERARILKKTVFFLQIDLRKKKKQMLSGLYSPLIDGKTVTGVLYTDMVSDNKIFDEIHIEVLEGICQLTTTLIKSTKKLIKIHRESSMLVDAYFNTITALAASIETRDNYTGAHTQRVTKIAELIAKEMDWSSEKIQQIRLGGILHDIGKIGIRDEILKKPGKLTPKEMNEIKKHPEIGANLVKNIHFLKPIIPFILCHQEHFDGKGYPFRLKGKQIPLEGRLMAVADSFDAMTSDRPYRKAMDVEKALEEILGNRGKQFDPEMVDIFLKLYKSGVVYAILEEFKKQGKNILCPFCSTLLRVESPCKSTSLCCPECGKKMKL